MSVALVVGALLVSGPAASAHAGVRVVRAAAAAPVFQLGVTHGHQSIDAAGDMTGNAAAERVLSTTVSLQNQHIMGWGADNPEPSPGQYNFSSLDARIALIRRTNGQPVITLCCSPDWMKGGAAGTTDWSRLEVAPTPDHFDDFAALAAKVALRYPNVTNFQVWNELKGFWNSTLNRWDYEGYTALYNKVYRAVKQVRPDAKIGGPYVVLDSYASAATSPAPSAVRGPWGVVDQRELDVLSYWLTHNVGADFVAVDAMIATRDRGLITDVVTATQKFAAIDTWLRARTSLPIWWSEFYVQPVGAKWTPQHVAAAAVAALVSMATSGANAALVWQPEVDGSDGLGLWSSTYSRSGGIATPLATILAQLRPVLAAAAQPIRGLPGSVSGLTTATTFVLVNVASTTQRTRLLTAVSKSFPTSIASNRIIVQRR
jgi:hypothetical protein